MLKAGPVDRFFWLSDSERRNAAELGDKCAEAHGYDPMEFWRVQGGQWKSV